MQLHLYGKYDNCERFFLTVLATKMYTKGQNVYKVTKCIQRDIEAAITNTGHCQSQTEVWCSFYRYGATVTLIINLKSCFHRSDWI